MSKLDTVLASGYNIGWHAHQIRVGADEAGEKFHIGWIDAATCPCKEKQLVGKKVERTGEAIQALGHEYRVVE